MGRAGFPHNLDAAVSELRPSCSENPTHGFENR
jgi:hypothetical protein